MGLDQTEFATAGGVSLNSQSNYERGKRSPDTSYLAKIATLGVDIQFLISGVRSENLDKMLEEARRDSVELVKTYSKEVDLVLLESVTTEILEVIRRHPNLQLAPSDEVAKAISVLYNNYKTSGKKPRKNDPSVVTALQLVSGL
ncbi:MAG: hypothetical protein DHS20C12_11780 [Pseudohongiella sp.]|nr:MAG: hypothetical protein DHS20C12_11780 [Pseudohongiella sp.]